MAPGKQEGKDPSGVTRILRRIAKGEADLGDELLDHVYAELLRIARHQMVRERPDHTLEPAALVHEAWLRLAAGEDLAWEGRGHFYRAAAVAMHRILVEHARRRGAAKRGGKLTRVPLLGADRGASWHPEEILAVDEALLRMQERAPQAAEIVRLRFFAGLSIGETAAAMDLSPRTVERQWLYARARLFLALDPDAS